MDYSEKLLKHVNDYLDIEDQIKSNADEHQAIISKNKKVLLLYNFPQEDQDEIEVLKVKHKQLMNRLEPLRKVIFETLIQDGRVTREAQQKL